MSWLEKLLPPKIQQTDPADRRSVPEGLWVKCPSCETVLYKTDLEQNQNVCPSCSHHHRIGARARLNVFLDNEGRYELGQEVIPVDPLKQVAQAVQEIFEAHLENVEILLSYDEPRYDLVLPVPATPFRGVSPRPSESSDAARPNRSSAPRKKGPL